jgi:hypothetical protein
VRVHQASKNFVEAAIRFLVVFGGFSVMALSPSERDQIGVAYCRIMEEVLIRDELLLNTLQHGLAPTDSLALAPEMGKVLAVEVAYLQLRFICELIALACLTAHGDIAGTRTKKVQKEYAADDIIRTLEGLHPDFYPQPTKQADAPDANRVWQNTPIREGYLTRADLIALYGQCGGQLHRGSARTLAKGRRTATVQEAANWAHKIWTLLQHHQIQTSDPDAILLILMKGSVTFRPQFSYALKVREGLWRIQGSVTAADARDRHADSATPKKGG